jgi:hypothetical protein
MLILFKVCFARSSTYKKEETCDSE